VGKSSVRWQDVTRSMLTESSAADYTYMRPSRRFIGQGLYLPSLRTEALGGLAIGFDTSGSMGQRECDQIGAELQAIVDDLNPAFIEIAYCDYAVTHVERFERDDPIKLHPKGGGGTRFAPVFEHFAEALRLRQRPCRQRPRTSPRARRRHLRTGPSRHPSPATFQGRWRSSFPAC